MMASAVLLLSGLSVVSAGLGHTPLAFLFAIVAAICSLEVIYDEWRARAPGRDARRRNRR